MFWKKYNLSRWFVATIIIVSLSFIIFNLIFAKVEETPGVLRDFIKNVNCPKFIKANEITAKDECTGVIWLRRSLPVMQEPDDPTPGYNWEEAKEACANLKPAGTYRLPTVEELLSLVKYKCDGSTCYARADFVRDSLGYLPTFSTGNFWALSDFKEPSYWTDPNADPPGVPARDYKRSVNLINGEVDTPVFGPFVRLNAICVVDRNPEIIEKSAVTTETTNLANGQKVTGGELKTVYHRQCTSEGSECGVISSISVCEEYALPGEEYEPPSTVLCGNEVINVGEQCDGNANIAVSTNDSSVTKQYACDEDCLYSGGYCGDNIIQLLINDAPMEQCDGTHGVATTPGESSGNKRYLCDMLINKCQFTGGYCGDNVLQTEFGEVCDDGNRLNDDACDNACQWTIKELTPITLEISTNKTVSGDGVVYDDEDKTYEAVDAEGGTYLKVASVMPTPYIWIANSHYWNGSSWVAYNRVSKLRTFAGPKRDCERSGGEVNCFWVDNTWETLGLKIDIAADHTAGRYNVGLNPSRTAVNVETGDVWVANRDSGSVTKLDINGVVLKTCAMGAGSGPRGLAIEEDGDVWVANYGLGTVVRIDGDDTTCPGSWTEGYDKVRVYGLPYGLAIDSNGNVWVSNSGAGGIQKIITSSTPLALYGYTAPSVYGIAIDLTDDAWGGYWTNAYYHGVWEVKSNAGNGTAAINHNYNTSDIYYDTTGITVDKAGYIWASIFKDNRIVKINPADGSKINYFDQKSGYNYSLPTGLAYPNNYMSYSNPHGIAGDSDGNIWSVQLYGDNVRVYGPNGGGPVNSGSSTPIDKCVFCTALPVESYTYSDMTGLNRAQLLRSGSWLATFDSLNWNQHWGDIVWEETDPDGGGTKQTIEVLVRASNSEDFSGKGWHSASDWNNTIGLEDKAGQYLQIKVKLRSRERGITPVVWNLQILNQ